MHNHHFVQNQHCNHRIKYCERCDVAYCNDCGKEWVSKWYTNTQPYQITCGTHYPNYNYVGLNGGGLVGGYGVTNATTSGTSRTIQVDKDAFKTADFNVKIDVGKYEQF